MPTLHLAQESRADALLAEDPLALLIGMVLDQQVPLERAFSAPADLKDRLGGSLDPRTIAGMEPEALVEAFRRRPALHRFPGSMAKRVQELCRVVADDYDGRAETVWACVEDGDELLARIRALPGFGDQKARIFVALLGKQFDVRPNGWKAVSAPFGEKGSFRSVADIDSAESLAAVRRAKKEAKASAQAGGAAAGITPARTARRGAAQVGPASARRR